MSFHSIMSAVFLAFFAFSVYQLSIDDSVSSDFKEQLLNQTKEHPVAATLFMKSLDDLNPQVKLPIIEKRIFLVNSFPLFAWSHLAVAILFVSVSAWIMRMMGVKTGKMFLILFLLLIVSYFVASILLLVTYKISGSILQIPAEEQKNLMELYGNQLQKVILPSLVFSVFAIFTLIGAFFKEARG